MNRPSKIVMHLFVTICTVLIAVNVHGQENTTEEKEKGGLGYAMFGMGMLDIENLNTRLQASGYGSISDNFSSFGGGGHAIVDRFIIGGEGNVLLGKETSSGEYKFSMTASYGFFNLGYIIYRIQDLNIYPLLGIGGGGISLKIAEQGTAPAFDEILENPRRSSELSTSAFLINLAIGADYLLELGKKEKERGGLVFGLRAGYTFALFKDDWYMNENQVPGAPELGITGPYIRFMFGGGGMGAKEQGD